MKVVTIVGARPQFIKSVPVSRELFKNNINEIIVHTGQHFDQNMSEIFFDQMNIQKPNYNLYINSLMHGAMTGQMLEKSEQILVKERPDFVIVYGDTNSTLAGALAASKLNIKIIHIEAGLRSFNTKMPEEINRIITDRISYYLFCPTQGAVKNLESEGFGNLDCKIINCGDVMLDAALMFSKYARQPDFKILGTYALCTLHRQENTDNQLRLRNILMALMNISKDIQIIMPLHPRTHKKISEYKLIPDSQDNLKFISPIGYLEMLYLIMNCSFVMTDSGGLQKEAFIFKKLCLTLREETEWIELVEGGFNFISGSSSEKILQNYKKLKAETPDFDINLYGNGTASQVIVKEILK